MDGRRTVILGEQLEGSYLIPLEVVRGKGVRSHYRCLCMKCGHRCIKPHRALADARLAKACPTCSRENTLQNSRFNVEVGRKT